MLDEAITLINKQIDMYIIQDQNIITRSKSMNIPNRVKKRLRKQILILQYILKILEERREQDANEKRRQKKWWSS